MKYLLVLVGMILISRPVSADWKEYYQDINDQADRAQAEQNKRIKERDRLQDKKIEGLKKSGMAGDINSLIALGDYYSTWTSLNNQNQLQQMDSVKAEMYYSLASIKGSDVAAYKLGIHYCRADLKRSFEYYKLSASRGNFYARCVVAKLYQSGFMGTIDMDQAESYYQAADYVRPRNDKGARIDSDELDHINVTEENLREIALIKSHYKKALAENDVDAQVYLGKLYDPDPSTFYDRNINQVSNYDSCVYTDLVTAKYLDPPNDGYAMHSLILQVRESIRFYEMASDHGDLVAGKRAKILKSEYKL